MEISDDLKCLFSAKIESNNGSTVISVPERELEIGDLEEGDYYRVAIFSSAAQSASNGTASSEDRERGAPVEEGEQYEVEIEDIGEQGDGIARIGPGYIVFVPSTNIGDRVTVEITDARENFAFAEVVEEDPISEGA